MPDTLTLTPEQQRIMELFQKNNPSANFAQNNAPQITQDTRAGNPYQDYVNQSPLITQQGRPQPTYQDAIRNRLQSIASVGANQSEHVFAAKQSEQIAAQQSYGSGQVLGQNTQYQPGVGGIRGAILKAAAAENGVPYSWGGGNASGATKGIGRGANTVGFDCSGLVQYAYAQVGIKMPRLAEQQATMGRRVGINQLRPGDLVAGPHHIAIYAGNGMMWEAPHTGARVRLTPVRGGMVGVALGI